MLLFVLGCIYTIKQRFGFFTAFQSGDPQIPYNSATTYALGDPVQYNFATWESLQDGNTGNTPAEDSIYWIKRNNSFIGVDERCKYTGRRLTLTWALNKQFGTTFRQPPWPDDAYTTGPAWPDIYITLDTPVIRTFVVGVTDSECSEVGEFDSTGYVSEIEDYGTASTFAYIIHFPVGVYSALGPAADSREAVVRQFVDKYNLAGFTYTIETY